MLLVDLASTLLCHGHCGRFWPVAEQYPVYIRGLAYLKAKQGTQRGIAKNSPLAALSQLQMARAQGHER